MEKRRSMTPGRALMLLAVAAVLMASDARGASRDDDFIVEYPDGNWGVNLGEEYVTAPDGSMLMSPDYREDYMNTSYGALTSDGFVVFPKFDFAGAIQKAKPVTRKTDEALIFYEATTAPPPGALWGFSTPATRGGSVNAGGKGGDDGI